MAAGEPFVGALYAADRLTGLALRGHDPVSYFLGAEPRPLPGRAGIELGHDGAVWRFASRANREAFRADPEVYTPRLGGYDVIGTTRGRIVDADPLVAALIGGRLYLFRAPEGRERTLAEPSLVAEAEARWPNLRP